MLPPTAPNFAARLDPGALRPRLALRLAGGPDRSTGEAGSSLVSPHGSIRALCALDSRCGWPEALTARSGRSVSTDGVGSFGFVEELWVWPTDTD